MTHLRNMARHVMVRDVGDPELSRYRTTLVGPVERFFLAPMHFNYHAEHHFYPMIPWHNLPEAHRILSRHPHYANVVDVQNGVLRFILTRVGSEP
jgi:fatty acid desaturase